MRKRTKKLLVRLIPIIIIFLGINIGFGIDYYLRIPKEWYTSTPYGGGYTTINAHSFNVNPQNKLVYMTSGDVLQIINVDNPNNPSLLSEFNKTNPATFMAREGDLLVLAGENDFNIINISNPALPVNLSIFNINVNYTIADVAIKGDYVFLAVSPISPYIDSLNFQVLVSVNISNPLDPKEGAMYRRYGFYSYSLTLHEDIAYITHPDKGIAIVNITNPENLNGLGYLTKFGLLSTYPWAINAYQTAIKKTTTATYILIADHDNGYIVADVTDPTVPQPIGGTSMPYSISLFATFNYAYVLQKNGTISVFSLTDPIQRELVGRFDPYNELINARDIYVHQSTNTLYLLRNNGLTMYNLVEGIKNDYFRVEAALDYTLVAIVFSLILCVPLGIAVIIRHRETATFSKY
ncbi:MAG: hypothetical protein JW776_04860 [Candidatus Lokiarchaeota archaeon]|nr:hypothetical protein [Candidatus Lokiarchaeota archaeon]